MTWHKSKQVKQIGGSTFRSINEAARDVQGHASNIYKALVGKRPSAYGYRWVYEERG